MSWERKGVGSEFLTVSVPEIVGKQRPRFDPRHGRTYTPAKTAKAEKAIRDAWLEKVGDRWAGFAGDVEVTVLFTRQLAKSNPKFWAGRADTGRPDIDNAMKCVLDALNGAAFKDDGQVTFLQAAKNARRPHGCGDEIAVLVRYYTETYRRDN